MTQPAPPIPSDAVPCLHVGYHKCASTTLQENFFGAHPQVYQLRKRKDQPALQDALYPAAESVRNGASGLSDTDLEQARIHWQEGLELARREHRLPLYSWENLTRAFYFRSPDDRRLPEILKAVVGDARIVIVIRHQIRLLESLYLSRIKPPDFIEPDAWLDDEGTRTTPAYCYNDIVEAYEAVFGADNVLVLPFETMKADPEGFTGRLSRHIGVDPAFGAGLLKRPGKNRRPSASVQTYSRLRRRILPNVSFGRYLPAAWSQAAYGLLSKGGGSKVVFPAERIQALEDVYRPQNRDLANRRNLDLAQFGYPL